jgi:hypothetical protein
MVSEGNRAEQAKAFFNHEGHEEHEGRIRHREEG